jgi:diacylglycerol kinase family enzyme
VVLNTNPYTYLGNRPLDLSPDASLDRGLVAITFRTMQVTAILKSLTGALKGGGVQPAPYLDTHSDLNRLEVVSAKPFPYQLDGDYLGESSALSFEHCPAAVRLCFPSVARA